MTVTKFLNCSKWFQRKILIPQCSKTFILKYLSRISRISYKIISWNYHLNCWSLRHPVGNLLHAQNHVKEIFKVENFSVAESSVFCIDSAMQFDNYQKCSVSNVSCLDKLTVFVQFNLAQYSVFEHSLNFYDMGWISVGVTNFDLSLKSWLNWFWIILNDLE